MQYFIKVANFPAVSRRTVYCGDSKILLWDSRMRGWFADFTAFALIDGDQYQPGNAAIPAGSLAFNSTNVFYRQIRNLVLDSTSAAI